VYSSKKSTTIHTGIIDGNAIKEMAKIVLSIEILPRDTMADFWDFCPKVFETNLNFRFQGVRSQKKIKALLSNELLKLT